MEITNAKILFPPFEGWNPNFIVSLADRHEARFTCDEMLFSEPVIDGQVTLNGQTFFVIYDKEAIDHTEGCEITAKLNHQKKVI